MTLADFCATRKVMTGQEMIDFLEKYDPTIYEGIYPFTAIHVYDESYWIEDYGNGNFDVHIETQEYEGTLHEMEKILYDWVYGCSS